MKWEARKMNDNKWGCFLMDKFCKTDVPVCYSAATGKYAEANARLAVKRMNESQISNELEEEGAE